VRVRRWRDLQATLYIPNGEPRSTLVIDGETHPAAAPLLASRGLLLLVVGGERTEAVERLATVPGATEPRIVPAAEVPLPPNVGATDRDPQPEAWDALRAS
jgi:hypothetical protein